ncbi:Uncharacterised protein [Salmonella enterica subsp. enterica]|nr:Uncharacterised protein [Salmonella enterica subsp. enterica] [Salmonella enterica subsp. enterica serovar Menston]
MYSHNLAKTIVLADPDDVEILPAALKSESK